MEGKSLLQQEHHTLFPAAAQMREPICPARKYPMHTEVAVKIDGEYRHGPVRGFTYRDRLYGVHIDGALVWLPEEMILPCS